MQLRRFPTLISVLAATLATGCRTQTAASAPVIALTRIPQVDVGGRSKNDIMEGRATSAYRDQRRIVKWWLQTLPREYAELVVNPEYRPYEWRVGNAPSRGGAKVYPYEAKNAWTDSTGTRGVGYVTCSFTVRNRSRMEPATVFGMFTWDCAASDKINRGNRHWKYLCAHVESPCSLKQRTGPGTWNAARH